jgi:GT2 family glycosyltransferase
MNTNPEPGTRNEEHRDPRLCIVIVTFNSRRDLDACLHSLTSAPPHVSHHIVIVDNASGDGTPAYVRERWPAVRLIEAGGNLGFAKANNLAIRRTTSELVLLLNPDTVVPPGALDVMVRVLDRSPDVAIVGPRIVDAHGRAELSFGPMISPLAELRQKLLVVGNDRGISPVVSMVERMTRRRRQVDWVSGACLLIRRQALEAVGLLDERFFIYTEDVDLCAAVRQLGQRVLFAPEAEIVHLRGRSVSTAWNFTRAAYRRSQIAFYAKHLPHWRPLLELYLRARGEMPNDDV